MSDRIDPQIMVQYVEFLQRCLDGNPPALRTLHEICTEITWLRGDVEVKWQSRAIAAEQERDQLKAEIADRETVQQDLLQTVVKSDEVISQLKAELQQAREWFKNDGPISYACLLRNGSTIVAARLLSICERIEKEKNQ